MTFNFNYLGFPLSSKHHCLQFANSKSNFRSAHDSVQDFQTIWKAPIKTAEILLPSARHLEEGRGTTILELPRLENCRSRLCPSLLGTPPPTHPNRVKNTQRGAKTCFT